jgi:hypothetical protein
MDLSMSSSSAPTAGAPDASTATAAAESAETAESSTFLDPAFVSRLLGSVDVDQNDPLIQAALAQLNAANAPDSKGGEDSKESRKRKGDDGP